MNFRISSGSSVQQNAAAPNASVNWPRVNISAPNANSAHDADIERQLADAHGEAGLQDQPVERDQRQPVVAARGQAALAAKLHQHRLAVG